MRATEAARPDRLHDDPLAAAVVASAQPIPPAPPGASEFMAVRTRFYDDFLAAAPLQVVVLAAGLDARAFRLPLAVRHARVRAGPAGTPGLQGRGDRRYVRGGGVTRVVVPIDLRDDWATALAAAGFSPEQPTAWIAEGLAVVGRGVHVE
jgi:O-methyltransferase involved in polyketide biosynthesis